jgi:spore coat polysaccharide biosynthesis protein SpsF
MSISVEQERILNLWKGNYGDEYFDRNAPRKEWVLNTIKAMSRILSSLHGAKLNKILEIGAADGINIESLQKITDADLYAIEPNKLAYERLLQKNLVPKENLYNKAMHEIKFDDNQFDLVFTKGVMVHIAEEDLHDFCAEMIRISSRYVVAIEFFADTVEYISHRGQKNNLIKRDYGEFLMDNYSNLSLVDYGFLWKKSTGLHNFTYWIFEKIKYLKRY